MRISTLATLCLASVAACAPMTNEHKDLASSSERRGNDGANLESASWAEGNKKRAQEADDHADIVFVDWGEEVQKRDQNADDHADVVFVDWGEEVQKRDQPGANNA
ncbi:hypothetical protein BDV24DRAFT_164008 [Aspergillus arachidicola]|uniref:Uncharacterized protein n=1 Tax=Aspergillus arachidicola TaxID=656916 RepID=A0A5N6Y8Q1_9EURO|nr:hypothetical protein BDV24DRAFT_164008 [Aspergillus arachidicola]